MIKKHCSLVLKYHITHNSIYQLTEFIEKVIWYELFHPKDAALRSVPVSL